MFRVRLRRVAARAAATVWETPRASVPRWRALYPPAGPTYTYLVAWMVVLLLVACAWVLIGWVARWPWTRTAALVTLDAFLVVGITHPRPRRGP